MQNKTTKQTFVEKCYKDKEGKVVFGQKPNLPIAVWAITRLLLFIVPNTSSAHTPLTSLSNGAMFVWAWLELFAGTTYLRRLLGGIVLLFLIF